MNATRQARAEAEPAGAPPEQFTARKFDLSGVHGLSKHAIDLHLALYEGYVKETNSLLGHLYEATQSDSSSTAEQLRFDGLVRRFAFERNGMALHELFFEALDGRGVAPAASGVFMEALDASYGGFDAWKRDVLRLSRTRGVGWVLTFRSAGSNRVTNVWVDDHRRGLLAGMKPIAAFDFWEHAYLLDFKPGEREKYLQVLFDNYCWDIVETRCQ
ncbi:MAG TPA: Fe-Mn family superoxide dismutase [Steroidobacteraceae bacterium]|nr:Fe-Mn family superoxide dismutase [Steroidobacteraceae bacterium]